MSLAPREIPWEHCGKRGKGEGDRDKASEKEFQPVDSRSCSSLAPWEAPPIPTSKHSSGMELELWPGGKEHPPANPRFQIKDWEYGGENLLKTENTNLGTSSQKCQFLSSSCSSFPKGNFGGVSSHLSWCPARIGIRIGIKIRIGVPNPSHPQNSSPNCSIQPCCSQGRDPPTPTGNCAWNYSTGCSSSVGLGISRSFFFPEDDAGCCGMLWNGAGCCGKLWDALGCCGMHQHS